MAIDEEQVAGDQVREGLRLRSCARCAQKCHGTAHAVPKPQGRGLHKEATPDYCCSAPCALHLAHLRGVQTAEQQVEWDRRFDAQWDKDAKTDEAGGFNF